VPEPRENLRFALDRAGRRAIAAVPAFARTGQLDRRGRAGLAVFGGMDRAARSGSQNAEEPKPADPAAGLAVPIVVVAVACQVLGFAVLAALFPAGAAQSADLDGKV
jgi:hypothetical protein